MSTSSSTLAFALLGSPTIVVNGRLFETNRRKDTALLIYLAVTGEGHQRDTLATLLWPEKDQATALSNLRKTISRLRKVLADFLVVGRMTLWLRTGYTLDVASFLAAATGKIEDEGALQQLEAAVALYRDTFLAGFTLKDAPEFDRWQQWQANDLQDRLTGALQLLMEAYSQQKQWEQAIHYGQRWLAIDPLHEPVHYQLMQLYGEAGQLAKALAQYETCQHLLAQELGVQPQAETIQLYDRFKRRDNQPCFSPDAVPDPGPLPVGSYLPLRSNPLFVGRREELSHNAQVLIGKGVGGTTIAITGLGGIGKTQLAVEFCHRYGTYLSGGVFWLSFANPAAIPTEVARCGGTDGLNLRPDFEDLPLPEQVKLVQRAWQTPIPRLLVFDNCEDETLLTRWRPVTGGCRLLLTSRRPYWDPGLGIITLSLDSLPRSESHTLLRHFVPGLADEEADAIAAELGDLPLALHLAGCFLSRYAEATSPAAYLNQLQRDTPLQHPSLVGHGVVHSPTAHVNHLRRTFALSYDQLAHDEIGKTAQRLLARAACFAPGEPVPRQLLLSTLNLPMNGLNERLFAEDCLGRLVSLSLLEERGRSALWLHRLLAAFVREMELDPIAQTAVETAILAELESIVDESGYIGPLSHLVVHLRTVIQVAQQRADERAASLCRWLGIHLRDMGDFAAARLYLEEALLIRQQKLDGNHPDLAQSLNDLGWALYCLGDYTAARPYLEQALSQRRRWLGAHHPDTAQSLNNLGWLLWKVGDLSGAQPLLEEALAVKEHTLGVNHPETARGYNSLAGLFWAQGHYARARPLLERAVVIREQTLGAAHPRLADSLNNFGLLLKAQGNYQEAQAYLERALAIRVQTLGSTHLQTAYSFYNLGLLRQILGNYPDAQAYLNEALLIGEQELGTDHLMVADCLNKLGLLHWEIGNLAEAQPMLERGLQIRQKQLPTHHPDVASSLHSLGLLFQAQGNLTAAYSYIEQAMAIRERSLGLEHPNTADSLNDLGELYYLMGNLAEAGNYLERALVIRQQKLGEVHSDTAITHHRLGRLQQAAGDSQKAKASYRSALTVLRQVLGTNHPYTQQVRRDLAALADQTRKKGSNATKRPAMATESVIFP